MLKYIKKFFYWDSVDNYDEPIIINTKYPYIKNLRYKPERSYVPDWSYIDAICKFSPRYSPWVRETILWTSKVEELIKFKKTQMQDLSYKLYLEYDYYWKRESIEISSFRKELLPNNNYQLLEYMYIYDNWNTGRNIALALWIHNWFWIPEDSSLIYIKNIEHCDEFINLFFDYINIQLNREKKIAEQDFKDKERIRKRNTPL